MKVIDYNTAAIMQRNGFGTLRVVCYPNVVHMACITEQNGSTFTTNDARELALWILEKTDCGTTDTVDTPLEGFVTKIE